MTDWPGDDRPSGILQRQRRFGVEKFVAWTAAISIGAGAGFAAWTLLRDADDDDADAEPAPGVGGTTGADTASTGEAAAPSPDAGAPRLDLGGGLRLDMPAGYWNDPSQGPSDTPGPDVEVPDWE
jgi:hypothetical protein